jgi:hypothetical protein
MQSRDSPTVIPKLAHGGRADRRRSSSRSAAGSDAIWSQTSSAPSDGAEAALGAVAIAVLCDAGVVAGVSPTADVRRFSGSSSSTWIIRESTAHNPYAWLYY